MSTLFGDDAGGRRRPREAGHRFDERGRSDRRDPYEQNDEDDRRDGGRAAIPEMHDERAFACRQAALRAIERDKRGELNPADKIFVTHSLYYADRGASHVQVMLSSRLRLAFQEPLAQLSSPDLTKAQIKDILAFLADMIEASASTVGAAGARSTSDAPDSFWARCQRYLEALEAAREADAPGASATAGLSASASASAKAANEEIEDQVLDLLGRVENLQEAAAELKALARSPDSNVDRAFFAAAALLADVQIGRRLLEEYHESYFNVDPLPPPPSDAAQAIDGEQTEGDCLAAMQAAGDQLEPEQNLWMDEIANWAKEHMPAWALQPGTDARKPERFAKVFSRVKWNRYNKAHYDYSNPPPRIVSGYEFTMLYPDLKSAVTPTFSVIPTEKGWSDEYCVLLFKAGPPYLDVAYRVVNQQWDQRRGGVKPSFDPASGRFRLYFRFTSTSYRR
jgi:hypothetical protein